MIYSAVVIAILGIAPVARGAGEPVVLRASTDPSEGILVGQRVRYRLDVLGNGGWASLPQLPRIEVPGALVYSPPSSSIRLSETIDGETYSGQRYEFWIYPQRTGPLEIPPVDADAQVRVFGVSADPETKKVSTESIKLEVTAPEGADATTICTSRLTAEQTWRGNQSTAVVGDGIERVITRTVGDAPGMVLGPVTRAELPGVRIYPKQPAVNDKTNRGEITGSRIDAATYVFEQPGQYDLPDVAFSWWNTRDDELRTETLPGITIHISPNPAAAQDSAIDRADSQNVRPWPRWLTLAAIILAVLCALAWRFRRWIAAYLQRWANQIRSSESIRFRQLIRVAAENDARGSLRLLMQWLDAVNPDHRPARADRFLDEFGDSHARTAVEQMVIAAETPENDGWDGQSFIHSIKRARRRMSVGTSR